MVYNRKPIAKNMESGFPDRLWAGLKRIRVRTAGSHMKMLLIVSKSNDTSAWTGDVTD